MPEKAPIAHSVAAGDDDPFVAHLLAEYLAGHFPVAAPAAAPAPAVADLLTSE